MYRYLATRSSEGNCGGKFHDERAILTGSPGSSKESWEVQLHESCTGCRFEEDCKVFAKLVQLALLEAKPN